MEELLEDYAKEFEGKSKERGAKAQELIVGETEAVN